MIKAHGRSKATMLAISPVGNLRATPEIITASLKDYFHDIEPALEDSFFETLSIRICSQIAFTDFGTFVLEPRSDLVKQLKSTSQKAGQLRAKIETLLKVHNGPETLFGWEMDFNSTDKDPLNLMLSMLKHLSEFEERYTYQTDPKEIYYRFIRDVVGIFKKHALQSTIHKTSELMIFLRSLEENFSGCCFPEHTYDSGREDYVREAMGRLR